MFLLSVILFSLAIIAVSIKDVMPVPGWIQSSRVQQENYRYARSPVESDSDETDEPFEGPQTGRLTSLPGSLGLEGVSNDKLIPGLLGGPVGPNRLGGTLFIRSGIFFEISGDPDIWNLEL
ncbi:unnamed protein product [Allacma fusca]|uniref:Glycine-rich protein n=1 Tax=Allacma fusca TaxID=39272 RepID=A0A8J2P3J9_9HEXA|nr:unnamed protein product [Allacma fusca]